VTPVEPQPFRLDVHDDVLDDLRERLSRTRWPDEIPGSGWQYGSNLAFVQRLTARWRDGFDWRAPEEKLNAFDQFQVPLDGINLQGKAGRRSCRSSDSERGNRTRIAPAGASRGNMGQ
jgi:hypothetical protein